MKILGFNPSHHGSVCLLEDGEIKYFIQEERIGNRKKYTGLPILSFIELIKNHKIDWITWGCPSLIFPSSNVTNFPYWQTISWSYNKQSKYVDYSGENHHLCHAAHAFYNSGFEECISIVIDGLGSIISNLGRETDSAYYFSYPDVSKIIHKSVLNPKLNFKNYKYPFNIDVSPNLNLTQIYEQTTLYLGFDRNSAGKIMGLAPYGKLNPSLPEFFVNNKGNPNIFHHKTKIGYGNNIGTDFFINKENNPELQLQNDPKEWHHDRSIITDLEKDLAWKVQNDTQRIVGDYIEKIINKNNLKQICCSGGYFLNCVTNYYLTKRFPDIEFYFEPIANDAGTAIGAAKFLWHSLTKDSTIRPFKSLYLGEEYSKEKLSKGIKKYVDK